ncbi:P-loop containing nucleoside triphosphate hydrolase protein [Geopyxis carbonaria]|nr:P-loop containing nucleoside triphosphate hydrolase protein [Geopyxis carbonaria]
MTYNICISRIARRCLKARTMQEAGLHTARLSTMAGAVVEDSSRHAYRWETTEPTPTQLQSASDYFLKHPPKLLWSRAKFREIDVGTAPEVVFLGRSNVGKSTMLNSLLGHGKMAYTSSKPGRTRLLNAFSVGVGGIVLVDVPGYGYASRDDWGVQIMKYIQSRKELRRTFVLIDAKHGPKKTDIMLLDQLGRAGVSYQIVLSKADRISPHEGTLQKLFEDMRALMQTEIGGVSGLGEILAVSADPGRKAPKSGLNDLRWAIMVACGVK